VLGASSGIGAAIAAHLARRGALVAACARRVCQIDGARSFRCDVTLRGDVERVVDEAEAAFGASLYGVVK
jgi:NAD(P)-dependent dehydrogenase (short-subunit alcohol dehydrogenase family)